MGTNNIEKMLVVQLLLSTHSHSQMYQGIKATPIYLLGSLCALVLFRECSNVLPGL